MPSPVTSIRPFAPGTSGWSATDLEDPAISKLWDEGRFEIIEGVLTNMPAALYDGQKRLRRLTDVVETYLAKAGRPERLVFEVDLILSESRVPKADAVLMTPLDEQRQREANKLHGRPDLEFGRILVPPTLLVESVSIGHERHDRKLKRDWYAQAGIANYWIFDSYQRSLECLVLDGNAYIVDQMATDDKDVRPSLFPGLLIPLKELWV